MSIKSRVRQATGITRILLIVGFILLAALILWAIYQFYIGFTDPSGVDYS